MPRRRLSTLIAFVGLLLQFSHDALAQPVDAETRGENLDQVVPTDEPSSKSTVATTNFDLLMIPSGTDAWTAVRIDTRSGKSWIVGKGNIWKAIQEPEYDDLVPGKFVLKSTRFAGSKFALLRMDCDSGKSWFLKDDRWLPMPIFAN